MSEYHQKLTLAKREGKWLERYIGQVFIKHIVTFEGFENEFETFVEELVREHDLSEYFLKIYCDTRGGQQDDTTAFITFRDNRDNEVFVQLVDAKRWPANRLHRKQLVARVNGFIDSRVNMGDLQRLRYNESRRDIAHFNDSLCEVLPAIQSKVQPLMGLLVPTSKETLKLRIQRFGGEEKKEEVEEVTANNDKGVTEIPGRKSTGEKRLFTTSPSLEEIEERAGKKEKFETTLGPADGKSSASDETSTAQTGNETTEPTTLTTIEVVDTTNQTTVQGAVAWLVGWFNKVTQ